MRPWHARAFLAGLFAGACEQRGCQLGLDMGGRPLRAARGRSRFSEGHARDIVLGSTTHQAELASGDLALYVTIGKNMHAHVTHSTKSSTQRARAFLKRCARGAAD